MSTINGTSGDDTLSGTAGNDSIVAGDGNDSITDAYGLNTILGGLGNDTIDVDAGTNAALGYTDAGAGNDYVSIRINIDRPYSVLLGAGNDHIYLRDLAWHLTLTTGGNEDTIEMPENLSFLNGSTLTVTDFATGFGGDVIDLDGFLTTALQFNDVSEWTPGKNPFAMGFLDLRQNGDNVELWFDIDGVPFATSSKIVVFQFTTLEFLSAENFNGYDPHAVANTAVVVSGDYTVESGETETALNTTTYVDLRAHYLYGANDGGDFVNHGTIETIATTSPGGELTGFTVSRYHGTTEDALFWNAEDGTFIVDEQRTDMLGLHSTWGFYAGQQTISFLNDGDFEVTAASGRAYGVRTGYDTQGGDSVVNNGTLTVTGVADAGGVWLGSRGSFENNGTLTVSGDDAAFGVYVDQYHNQSIVNNGTINVTVGPTPDSAAVAIYLPEIEDPFGGSYQHWNTGTINAEFAYFIVEVNEGGDYVDVLHNSGTINGAVFLAEGNDIVYNTGTMSSGTLLEDGDDLYDGTGGTHTGWVDGGAGDDTFIIDDLNTVFFGSEGDDTVITSVDGLWIPTDIENVTWLDGAQALPYFADAILSGQHWGSIGAGSTPLKYAFLTEATEGATSVGSSNFYVLDEDQRQLARDALDQWAAVSGLSFEEVEDPAEANLTFGSNDQPDTLGYALYPPFGEIYIDQTDGFTIDVLLHEVGHALGLKHSFEEGAVLPETEDNDLNTVMSYTIYGETPTEVLGTFDIAAIQYLYGVNASERSDDDIYTLDDGYIWDGGGNDTISAAGETLAAHIDLNDGRWNWIGGQSASILSEGQSFLGYHTAIENAIGGSGADTLIGNELDNVLDSGAGNDTIDGGAGDDTMTGGDGDDTYVVSQDDDEVVEASGAGSGNDHVKSSVTYVLGDDVEQLTLTGTAAINGFGNGAANAILGNGGNNTLAGGAGNDTLDAGAGNDLLDGGADNDVMTGGAGDDFFFYTAGDTLVEASGAGSGNDTVQSAAAYTLLANFENLTLTGTSAIDGTGNDSANTLIGNNGNNTLSGLDGNDTLSGNGGNDLLDGGDGSDVMIGGAGNDTYIYTPGDAVIDASGVDTVKSATAYTLFADFENLTLTGTGAVNGTGNLSANALIGNSANNVLSGLNGIDTLDGGAGNDTLDGGSGNDSMTGGAGNDTFIYTSGDALADASGTDTVKSATTYTLLGGFENLTLTGTTAINGIGNSANNTLTGNGMNNTLTGLGGNDKLLGGNGNDQLKGGGGNDTLTGGAGNDKFFFDTALNASTNKDTILDFTHGGTFTTGDKIVLKSSLFHNLTIQNGIGNHLDIVGNSDGAQGLQDWIVYDPTSGALFYDSNGSAANGRTQFAILDLGGHTNQHPATLTNVDFLVVG